MFGTQHNSVPKTWVLEVPHSKAFVKLCKNLAKIEKKTLFNLIRPKKLEAVFLPYR